jgi:hypothetical protein
VEAGRLEVEKARLEVELAAARQRIQVFLFWTCTGMFFWGISLKISTQPQHL